MQTSDKAAVDHHGPRSLFLNNFKMIQDDLGFVCIIFFFAVIFSQDFLKSHSKSPSGCEKARLPKRINFQSVLIILETPLVVFTPIGPII